MRRTLRILSVALITAGCVILVDAGLTLAWKEPVSAIYAQLKQDEANDQLRQLEQTFSSDPEVVRLAETPDPEVRARRLARLFARRLKPGTGIGKITIPAAGIDYVIVEGTDAATLEKGPGRYPETALPGQGKTIGIAGHRTTYGAPFRKINKIEEGDEIVVEMPYATFTYEFQKAKIVEPTDTHIVGDIGREQVVLTACHPLYSAAQRYAVFGVLSEVEFPPTAPGRPDRTS